MQDGFFVAITYVIKLFDFCWENGIINAIMERIVRPSEIPGHQPEHEQSAEVFEQQSVETPLQQQSEGSEEIAIDTTSDLASIRESMRTPEPAAAPRVAEVSPDITARRLEHLLNGDMTRPGAAYEAMEDANIESRGAGPESI